MGVPVCVPLSCVVDTCAPPCNQELCLDLFLDLAVRAIERNRSGSLEYMVHQQFFSQSPYLGSAHPRLSPPLSMGRSALADTGWRGGRKVNIDVFILARTSLYVSSSRAPPSSITRGTHYPQSHRCAPLVAPGRACRRSGGERGLRHREKEDEAVLCRVPGRPVRVERRGGIRGEGAPRRARRRAARLPAASEWFLFFVAFVANLDASVVVVVVVVVELWRYSTNPACKDTTFVLVKTKTGHR